jgi:hypothetical protein
MTQTAEINHAEQNAAAWYADIVEMLTWEDSPSDEQMERIQESPLSVTVRDGWHVPGNHSEGPEEYEILLTTGGPALRIYGHLDAYSQPHSAELQYQDWGTPWTRYPSPEADLLRFAQCFYFGE